MKKLLFLCNPAGVLHRNSFRFSTTTDHLSPSRTPSSAASPPPPPVFSKASQGARSKLEGNTKSPASRTPSEVLDILIDHIPTFAVDLQVVQQSLSPEAEALIGPSPAFFLKKYRFFFDVQQHHGRVEVKLRPELSHPRRGAADVRFASGVGSADFMKNSGDANRQKLHQNSEAHLVLGLASRCPSEFSPLGEILSVVSEYVQNHPAFDNRIGVTGLLEKYPEYFQIVDGKVRVRPSTIAPYALSGLSASNSPLKEIVAKVSSALPREGTNIDLPKLFGILNLEEKQSIKEHFRNFPRFLRIHGKEFVVTADNSHCRKFVPENESSADALATNRTENDILSPSDPIHQIPANMDASSAGWAIKELYDALPLMQAAELDDFRLILPRSVRDALPKELAEELKKYKDFFSVWQYPDDPSVTIVQRAKVSTPDIDEDDLARIVTHLVPQGGIAADKLLRKLPLHVQRYLYAHGLLTTVRHKLHRYLTARDGKVYRVA